MNLVEMFENSVQLEELCKSITHDTPLSEVLIASQLSVNKFLSEIGNVLRADVVADTFMNYSQVFCTETIHPFVVCATLLNQTTGKRNHYAFPFKMVLSNVTVGTIVVANSGLHYGDDWS